MKVLTYAETDPAKFLRENFGAGNAGKIFRVLAFDDGGLAIEELCGPSLPSDVPEKSDAERIEKEDHMPLHIAFSEDERQLLLMAMADLALSFNGGFDRALGKIADHMQGHKMFTAFKKYRAAIRRTDTKPARPAESKKEERQSMKPSIGRIVHYVNYHGAHQPALITRVSESGSVDLEVFGTRLSSPDRFAEFVYMDERFNSNTWHWPERED